MLVYVLTVDAVYATDWEVLEHVTVIGVYSSNEAAELAAQKLGKSYSIEVWKVE